MATAKRIVQPVANRDMQEPSVQRTERRNGALLELCASLAALSTQPRLANGFVAAGLALRFFLRFHDSSLRLRRLLSILCFIKRCILSFLFRMADEALRLGPIVL